MYIEKLYVANQSTQKHVFTIICPKVNAHPRMHLLAHIIQHTLTWGNIFPSITYLQNKTGKKKNYWLLNVIKWFVTARDPTGVLVPSWWFRNKRRTYVEGSFQFFMDIYYLSLSLSLDKLSRCGCQLWHDGGMSREEIHNFNILLLHFPLMRAAHAALMMMMN